jgi:hypothetical protein
MKKKDRHPGKIRRLKNGKAPGSDNLQAELYKFRGKECEKKIQELIIGIWDAEGMPKECNLILICPILKKGDPLICCNYRGLSLLNVACKILFMNDLCLYTEKIIGIYRCGFRPNNSTVEQIFTLQML